MQTREPRKRVNWVFVFVLIVAVPLLIFTIVMLNTIPRNPGTTSGVDSTGVGASSHDSLMPDTSSDAWRDSTLRNN